LVCTKLGSIVKHVWDEPQVGPAMEVEDTERCVLSWLRRDLSGAHQQDVDMTGATLPTASLNGELQS
jgi:hypothetical protein